MKFAVLNDTHAGIRNSSEIFLDNAEIFYRDVFFPYLEKEGINHIVHLGDYYDNRKFINFRALHRNRKMFLAELRERGITMDIIYETMMYSTRTPMNSMLSKSYWDITSPRFASFMSRQKWTTGV